MLSLPPVHNIACDQYESTDAVDTDQESDEDDEIDNDNDDEDMDPSWKLADVEQFLSDDDMEVEPSEDEFQESPPHREKKFLVFGSCLNELLKRCPECGDAIIQQKNKTSGSMLLVELTCHSGHTKTWESQPVVKRKPLGNLLLAAAILFTGNTFTSISNLASCLNLQFFCERVFYDTQRKYLFPVVNEAWEVENNKQIDTLTSKAVVNLEGDGRWILQADQSTIGWCLDERTDQYAHVQGIYRDRVELQSGRRGDPIGTSRLGQLSDRAVDHGWR